MSLEDKLKEYIIQHHKSIRSFSETANIPYSTLNSLFIRGIFGGSLSNVTKICNALNIDIDALAREEIVIINKQETSITNNLTSDEEAILSLYRQLDNDDKLELRGEIRGTVRQMLKDEKYLSKKELKNA